ISYVPSRDDHTLGRGVGMSNPDAKFVKNDGALFRAYVKIKQPGEELYTYVRSRRQRMGFHRENRNIFVGFNIGINFSFSKLTKNEVEIEIEKRRFETLLNQLLKMIKDIMDIFCYKCLFSFDHEANMADYQATALRLNVPVSVGHTEEYVLDEHCEQRVQEQIKKQLGHLLSHCVRNEIEDAPSVKL
ncbi:hypothetical protein P3C80_30695, partial [Pseudomonas aeruginosa]